MATDFSLVKIISSGPSMGTSRIQNPTPEKPIITVKLNTKERLPYDTSDTLQRKKEGWLAVDVKNKVYVVRRNEENDELIATEIERNWLQSTSTLVKKKNTIKNVYILWACPQFV